MQRIRQGQGNMSFRPRRIGSKEEGARGEGGGCTSNAINPKLGKVDLRGVAGRGASYGACTGPSCGVFTGVARPTTSVRMLVLKLVTQRLPLASIATAKPWSTDASCAHPAAGERIWPGEVAAEPARSVMDDP